MKPNLLFVFTLTALLLHQCASSKQNATDGQQNNINNDNKNAYLIGEQSEYHLEKEYNAIDQCYQKEIGKKIGSFSLNFKFYGILGDCKEGTLFCYPGTLDQSGVKYNLGMIAGTKYIVQNEPNNSVALECAEKQKLACEQSFCMRGTVWHGIRVSRQIDGKICLELSIAKEKYEFKYVDQFNILFGDEHSLWTILTDGFGRQIEFHDDDKMRDAYLTKMAQNDAKLSNYVGFWMLGLDFLPMLSRRTAHLHVYRDCECEMHAWFHNPNENPHSSIANVNDHPPIPKECVALGSNETEFSLRAHAKISNSIFVIFRLAKNANYVSIWLMDHNGSNKFNISITDQFIHLHSNEDKIGQNFTFKSLPKCRGKHMSVQIVVQPYLYEIFVNGKKYGNFMPWPVWWQNRTKTEGIQRVTLKSDNNMTNVNALLSTNYIRTYEPAKSFVQVDEFSFGGYLIHFKGKIDPNAEDVLFYLLLNAREINDFSLLIMPQNFVPNSPFQSSVGSTFLALEMYFPSNLLMAKYQKWNETTNSNEWFDYDDEAIKLDFLRPGEPFELHIDLLNAAYGDNHPIMINLTLCTKNGNQTIYIEKHEPSLKRHYVSTIGAEGSVALFALPTTTKKEKSFEQNDQLTDDSFQKLLEIDPLLSVGDSIEIEGALQIMDGGNSLDICLLHDSMSMLFPDNHIPLGIHFDFIEPYNSSKMLVHSFSKKICPKREGECHFSEIPSRLYAGEEFKMRILVRPNSYKIYIHGALAFRLPSGNFPFWAGNILVIRGQLQNVTAQINRVQNGTLIMNLGEIGTTKGQMPIVAKLANKNATSLLYTIHINGIVKKAENFTVSLLHSSLEPSEILGKVLLQMNFSNSQITYEIYYNQSGKVSIQPQNQTEMPFNLHISIRAHDVVEFKYNNAKWTNHSRIPPTWAIQYIRFDGALKVHEITEDYSKKDEWGDYIINRY